MAERTFKPRKERKSFGLPIVIDLSEDGIKLPARLNNISEGGINFKSNALFPDGEELDIEIPYPKQAMLAENRKPIMIRVKVVWSKDFRDDKDPLVRYIHGCQVVSSEFDKTSDGIKELIKLSEKLGERPMGY